MDNIQEIGGSSFNWKKWILIIFLSLVLLVLIFLGIYFFVSDSSEEYFSICGDGTFFGECSLNQPYYCEEGVLIEKAEICGCPVYLEKKDNFCISKFQNNSKEVFLDYRINEQDFILNYTVYEDMTNYLYSLPSTIYYNFGDSFSRLDFKLRNLENKTQTALITPLVVEIQNRAINSEDQARIAISLVQNIPFGYTNKTIRAGSFRGADYSRHPYEVLYDNEGICGEKSELLALLLRELGYGVVFFYYLEENHEAVGIKCPVEYSVNGSGYCFVETSGPAIIGDSGIVYEGGIELNSDPEILVVSEGISLGEDLEEYEDARDLMKIRNFANGSGKLNFFKYYKLKKLQKKYGLSDVYRLD